MKSMHRGLVSAVIAGGLLCGALGSAADAATKPAKAAPAAAAPAATAAGAPVSIGSFKTWTAWTGKDASGMTCYISAEPASSKPAGLNRDPIHFLIVDRKGAGTKNEVQTLIGYTFKKDSKPTAAIDSKTYPMIADGTGAWLAAEKDEPGFVAALKKGTTLTIKGTSARGTETTDTYTLSGVTAAVAAIEKACS